MKKCEGNQIRMEVQKELEPTLMSQFHKFNMNEEGGTKTCCTKQTFIINTYKKLGFQLKRLNQRICFKQMQWQGIFAPSWEFYKLCGG